MSYLAVSWTIGGLFSYVSRGDGTSKTIETGSSVPLSLIALGA